MTKIEVLRDDIDLLGGALTEALDTLEQVVSDIEDGFPVTARKAAEALLLKHGRLSDRQQEMGEALHEALQEIKRLRDENQAILRELARAKGAIA